MVLMAAVKINDSSKNNVGGKIK
jgi:hypothetical protein